jgi:hypothetical protein
MRESVFAATSPSTTIIIIQFTVIMDPRIPIIEETPPQQRTALLPVEKLKHLYLMQSQEFNIKEFRLNGRAESLKAFVDLFLLKNGKFDNNRIVWITEDTFVRLSDHRYDLPGVYRDRNFSITLSAPESSESRYNHNLNIHSSTTEEVIAAFDLLAGLQDSYFKRIELRRYYGDTISCPLSGRHLENFVRNANRENAFFYLIFTSEQCRTLATSGIRTNIGFYNCDFEDEGIAFVEASAARENQDSGPAKLHF